MKFIYEIGVEDDIKKAIDEEIARTHKSILKEAKEEERLQERTINILYFYNELFKKITRTEVNNGYNIERYPSLIIDNNKIKLVSYICYTELGEIVPRGVIFRNIELLKNIVKSDIPVATVKSRFKRALVNFVNDKNDITTIVRYTK